MFAEVNQGCILSPGPGGTLSEVENFPALMSRGMVLDRLHGTHGSFPTISSREAHLSLKEAVGKESGGAWAPGFLTEVPKRGTGRAEGS